MVTAPASLAGRLARAARTDMTGFAAQVRALCGEDACRPGLYGYRLGGAGGRRRVHVRLERKGGLLFLNGVEALRLPPVEAPALKLALDDLPPARALATLRLAFPAQSPAALEAEYAQAQQRAARLAGAEPECWACRLELPQPLPFTLRPTAPYKADVALSYACDNRCAHCYNEPTRRALPPLGLEPGRRVLRKLWEAGVPYVIFTGGEPTLDPHLVDLVAYAEGLGQIVGLNTNGRSLARGDLAPRLAQAGLDHVQVTLLSPDAATHNGMVGAPAWAETVAGIRACLAAGLHTLTNTTLLEANADQVGDLVEFLYGLGVRTFALNGLIHSGCGRAHSGGLSYDRLALALEVAQRRAADLEMRLLWYTPTPHCRLSPLELGLGHKCCNAAEYSVCVEPNGDVLPCQSYYHPAGNLLREPWERSWESDLFRHLRYRREHPQETGLPESCADCERLTECGGGCMLERLPAQAEVSCP